MHLGFPLATDPVACPVTFMGAGGKLYYVRRSSRIELENLHVGPALPGMTQGVEYADLRLKNHFFL